jgi:UDP-GlcNAc:undecaprenyl-phosphate GlcNAc-1-phosphate transferase
VTADKSENDALQVGGLPLWFFSLISLGTVFVRYPYLLSPGHQPILIAAGFSWIGVFLYGSLDDRFEIRPVVKLTAQLFLASVVCLTAATVISPTNSAIIFIIMTFFSAVILNGANLIDGLDTLSFKVSAVIYFGYLLLAANIACLSALFLTAACFFIMCGFYFFNREPSVIHLGEVGVSCLGFSYIILSLLIYDGYSKLNPPLYALTKALLPVVILLVEVGVSFLRRLFAGKSPFQGDKLHVHHILHRRYGFSASTASSLIAGSYLLFLSISCYLMEPLTSLISFIFLTLFWTVWSFAVGASSWFRGQIRINFLEAFLVKEEVKILPASSLRNFRIIVNEQKDKS